MKKLSAAAMLVPFWAAALPAAALAAQKQRSPAGLPAPPETIKHLLEQISTVIELVGIAVIIVGGIVSTVLIVLHWRRLGSSHDRYHSYRANLGRSILLGLEFLVAADIIGTVAAVPTFESLGILAIIVLIRTFLSFALETEIQGRFPWRDAEEDRKRRAQRQGA